MDKGSILTKKLLITKYEFAPPNMVV